MAVLDAWAYGLPVVTTPLGGVPDVAVEGENMLLFELGNINTLAKKLELIIVDAELRERLAEESKKLASEKFNLKTVTEEVTEIYEGILAR